MDILFKDEFDMLDKLDWSSTEHVRKSQDPDKIINTDPDEEFYIVRKETFGDLQTPESLEEKGLVLKDLFADHKGRWISWILLGTIFIV